MASFQDYVNQVEDNRSNATTAPAKPISYNQVEQERKNAPLPFGANVQQQQTPQTTQPTQPVNAPNAFVKPQGLDDKGLQPGHDWLSSRSNTVSTGAENAVNPTSQQNLRQKIGGPTVTDNLLSQGNADAISQNWNGIMKTSRDNIKNEAKQTADNAISNWRDAVAAKANEEQQKKNQRRLAVNAIGDALRHMGNLYYTTKGAIPQTIADRVTPEWNRQEAKRKEDEAKALAAEQTAYKRAQDAIANQFKYKDDSRKDAELGLKVNDEKRKQESHPVDLEKKKWDLDSSRTKASVDKAKAPYVVAEAQNKAAESGYSAANEKKRGGLIDANIRRTNESTKNLQVSRSKTMKEIERMDKSDTFTIYGDGEDYTLTKNNYQSIAQNLRSIASKNGWFKNATEEHRATDKELLTAAYEHLNDSEVKDLLRRASNKQSHKL